MITVVGANELIARFLRGVAVGEIAVIEGQEQLAEDVEGAAKAGAPVDTGALRDSITHDHERVYTDLYYAPFVEYGTATNGPQPFLRPAADTVDASESEHAMEAVMGAL